MARLTRRDLLRLAALVVPGIGLGRASLALAAKQPTEETIIGTSQGGYPLVVRHLGGGARRVLLLGGQHGGPEANTIVLVEMLVTHFLEQPEALPPGVGIDALLQGNPDGAAIGSRQFLSGVDPNRNWDGPDWASDAYDSNGHFRPGLGGSEPFSEPETRALADWLLATRPSFVVNYHSAGGFLLGPREGLPGELADAYAEASGYLRPAPGAPSPLPYRASGSMNVWLRSVNLAGVLVELSTLWAPELERNLAGLEAVLARLAVG